MKRLSIIALIAMAFITGCTETEFKNTNQAFSWITSNVIEARARGDVTVGQVSAWIDEAGDWFESFEPTSRTGKMLKPKVLWLRNEKDKAADLARVINGIDPGSISVNKVVGIILKM